MHYEPKHHPPKRAPEISLVSASKQGVEKDALRWPIRSGFWADPLNPYGTLECPETAHKTFRKGASNRSGNCLKPNAENLRFWPFLKLCL